MFSNYFLYWFYLWPQAIQNFFQVPETCVLDELHVFAHNVPTFLNAVQYFFTSTHTWPSWFTSVHEVLANSLPVSLGHCTQPMLYKSSYHINIPIYLLVVLSHSELPAVRIPLSMSQYLLKALAHKRCQKLCTEWQLQTLSLNLPWDRTEQAKQNRSHNLCRPQGTRIPLTTTAVKFWQRSWLIMITAASSSLIFIWHCGKNKFYMHTCKPVEIRYDSPVCTECIWNAREFPNHMWLTGAMQIGFSFSARKSVQYSKFWYTGNLIGPTYFLCGQI